MTEQEVIQLYATTRSWTSAMLDGIKEKIEKQLPELKKIDGEIGQVG